MSLVGPIGVQLLDFCRSASLTNIPFPLRSHSFGSAPVLILLSYKQITIFVMRSRKVCQLSGVLIGRAKIFVILVSHWLSSAFLSVAWPTGVQLLVFVCSSVPVVLFDTPWISRCRSQHVSVWSSSLLHHSIYLWFICFTWWSIDKLENLHADRTNVCFEPW